MNGKHFDIDAAGVYSNLDKTATKRRRYTKKPPAGSKEAAERAEAMRTQGREGCALPRINLAFSPTNYEYAKIMAGVTGQSMTRFINSIVEQHKRDHMDLFLQCCDIKAEASGTVPEADPNEDETL